MISQTVKIIISTVNLSEVVAKIVDGGGTAALAAAMLDPLHLQIAVFDQTQAIPAGALLAPTRAAGLSFGARACLALAATRRLIALTSDRAWQEIDLDVELIR